ncbi:MAG: tetratricopeptide repeat protein [Tenacibaculum sp.]
MARQVVDKLSSIKTLGEIAFDNYDYQTAKECFDLLFEKTDYKADKLHAIYMKLQIGIANKEPNLTEEFKKTFDEFGINSKTLYIQLAYADFLTFHQNKPEKAIPVLEKAINLSTSKYTQASVKLKLGEVLVFTQKFSKALIYFSQVQTQFKNHPLAQEARFKVAQTSYFNMDFTWAKAQLKILKGSATQLIANDATELFLIISNNQPSDSIPTGLTEYAKADLLAYQNKNKLAIATLNTLLVNYKNQNIEDQALYKQALLYTKTKQFNKAAANYEKILQLNPKGLLIDNSLYKLAELYNGELRQPNKASEYYQKIIFNHPSSIYLVDARNKYRKLRGDNI